MSGRILSIFIALLVSIEFASGADLSSIQSWGYQLQETSFSKVRNATYDLMVIEPVRSFDPYRRFSAKQIRFMKNEKNPEKKKLLLAYLSIGEAEDYRAYWKKPWLQSPPSWLGRENPDWRGNYKVRFWNKDWKKIAFAELARIVKSGFDGVYLDIVDAFYYWSLPETFQNRESKKKNDPKDEAESAERMIDFLGEIASRARKQSGGFLVFPQNGETILLSATPEQRKLYWETVDGIGVEDVFHSGPDDENNPANVEAYRLELLARFVQKKKPVLSVEYLTKPKLVQTFTVLARKKGFIPLTTIRSLDR